VTKKKRDAAKREGPVSLHPIPPEEATADLLKVKPERRKEPKKRGKRKRHGGKELPN
jgi:hypothetical protein